MGWFISRMACCTHPELKLGAPALPRCSAATLKLGMSCCVWSCFRLALLPTCKRLVRMLGVLVHVWLSVSISQVLVDQPSAEVSVLQLSTGAHPLSLSAIEHLPSPSSVPCVSTLSQAVQLPSKQAAHHQLPCLWPMQALELFLDCCRHKAIQPLESAAQAGLQHADLQNLLTTLAATVQVRPV